MRSLPLLFVFAACTALSPDERQQLASYQSNAQLYFDGGKLDQALGMIQRGLELDPYDYKLRSLQGATLLRQSGPPLGGDHSKLDAALADLEQVYGWRAPERHDTHLLFFYALARQKQGLRLTAEAARQQGAARNSAAATGAAAATEASAQQEFAAAAEVLQIVLDRGEQLRLCHYHLMQIAALTHDADGVVRHGNAYLDAAGKEQALRRSNYERTTVLPYESEQKTALETLRDEEIQVRTFLANRLFDQKDYALALTHVDAVLALDPTRSANHYNRGRILRLLGRTEEAKADMRKFLATTTLPPDNPKVVDAVEILAK
jgi:tetratricopeptide (TPR) repeat protein